MSRDTDRIQKKAFLRAPRGRVWRALTDGKQFGAWFGMKLHAPFAPGAVMHGTIVPTVADAEVAKMQKPYEGAAVELQIDRIEPETLFSFRWHPFAADKNVDYSAEPTTLVVFELEEDAAGTRLTLTESGFDAIPLWRRAAAFAANEGGWSKQMELIEKYLEQTS